MRGAFVAFLKELLVSQGAFADGACNVGGKGCSVVLLDMRRDYRLISFKKRDCRIAGDTAFVCRFDAKVTCAYSADGKPRPDVADLYCGPLYNKTSAYTRHVPLPGAGMGHPAFRFRLTRDWKSRSVSPGPVLSLLGPVGPRSHRASARSGKRRRAARPVRRGADDRRHRCRLRPSGSKRQCARRRGSDGCDDARSVGALGDRDGDHLPLRARPAHLPRGAARHRRHPGVAASSRSVAVRRPGAGASQALRLRQPSRRWRSICRRSARPSRGSPARTAKRERSAAPGRRCSTTAR